MDNEGAPRSEFFLVCHTGTEIAPRMFVFSADELMSKFEVTPNGRVQSGKYALPGKSVLRDKACEILDKSIALNRIENALTVADFKKNRSFMSWMLPNAQPEKDAIEPIYKELVSYYSPSIADDFLHMKKSARKGLSDIEEIHHILRGIVEATDPEEAFDYASELEMLCKGGDRWFINLPRDIQNKDWEGYVREHKQQVIRLKELGMLDNFSSLALDIKSHFTSIIHEIVCSTGHRDFLVEVSFNSDNLSNVTINSRPINYEQSGLRHCHKGEFVKASSGKISFHFRPYGYLDDLLGNGKTEEPEAFFTHHLCILQPVLGAILNLCLNP